MNLHINDFDGPLDLLLHLVKTAKMDIYEIDTAYIIDAYLDFINKVNKNDLDRISEYLVMASELIHLKSRLLLNIDEETNDDEYSINSEEDLKNKLIEYERYKKVCDVFKDLEINRQEYYTKIPEAINLFIDSSSQENYNREDPNILANALEELKKRMSYQKPLNTRIMHKEISVEDRTKYIRKFLKNRSFINFFDLFEDYSKELVVATFLSILNMCKEKEITLKQKNNFDDILIEKVKSNN